MPLITALKRKKVLIGKVFHEINTIKKYRKYTTTDSDIEVTR